MMKMPDLMCDMETSMGFEAVPGIDASSIRFAPVIGQP